MSTTPTLRDRLAMAALAGGLEQGTRDNMDSHYWHQPSVIAQRAYAIADAMLEARERKPPTSPRRPDAGPQTEAGRGRQ